MSATILDGRLVSDSLLKEVAASVHQLKAKGVTPKLVIVLVGDNPASLSYIKQKKKAAATCGIIAEEINLPPTTTTEELLGLIEKLNADPLVHGMLVQLPLPAHIPAPLIIRAISPEKDADGFHAYNVGKMFLSQEFERLAPCTPQGVIKIFEHYKIPLEGQNIVILGRSNIVGKPLAVMLMNRDATVTVCHSKTRNLAEHTRAADILIVAIGKANFIRADMVKEGAVVIDVGMNKLENKLVGDVDFESVSPKASAITPVPGGVGPMTVTCLMENLVKAALRQTQPH